MALSPAFVYFTYRNDERILDLDNSILVSVFWKQRGGLGLNTRITGPLKQMPYFQLPNSSAKWWVRNEKFFLLYRHEENSLFSRPGEDWRSYNESLLSICFTKNSGELLGRCVPFWSIWRRQFQSSIEFFDYATKLLPFANTNSSRIFQLGHCQMSGWVGLTVWSGPTGSSLYGPFRYFAINVDSNDR